MDAKKILDVQGVTVSFDGFKALDGLDFSMFYGEIRFLIGPNGAGKTSLLDIITGKTRPTKGRVLFDGDKDLKRWPEHRRVQNGIGRKFQTPSVFSSLTVYENLEAAIGVRESAAGLFHSLSSARQDAVHNMLLTTGLQDHAHVRAGTLAHGQKQWLEIGMLVIQQPKLLLLDEPVAGMTRQDRERTGQMLQEIAQERSVLVVEHDMEFVRRFAKTVTVLHTGKMLCEGPVDVVQKDARVIEVYLGRSKEEPVAPATQAVLS
ncbi:MAG: urea ABC transporter ATP-binding protein UrtD [Armatimonadota bacterium]|nr:urea ABC transporter ATP-binding protein UrtD [Armatimonadota bacterium]